MSKWILTSCLVIAIFGKSLYCQDKAAIGYDFNSPVLLSELPKVLKEISGLSLSPRTNELLAIQDEDGLFFRIDINTGKLLESTEFWKAGDYEGVERVGDDIWIVKNTGTLYRVRQPGTDEQEVTKFNGFLDKDNDVEGLAYDPINHQLLLPCKSYFGGDREKRSVFAFNLETEQFLGRPVINIGREQILAYLGQCTQTSRHAKILNFIGDEDGFRLGPSAIAIHPITGQYFLASSAGKLIIVLTPEGAIEHVRKLDKAFFLQPEGLAFTPNGTLYISTEGRGDIPARIYRLKYQPGFEGM